MRKFTRFTLLLLLVSSASGCEIGRSWFSMNSDSPMPFFGFDLMPRRRTTELTVPRPGERGTASSGAARPIQPTADRHWTGQQSSRELHLLPASQTKSGQEGADLSLSGPSGYFLR